MSADTPEPDAPPASPQPGWPVLTAIVLGLVSPCLGGGGWTAVLVTATPAVVCGLLGVVWAWRENGAKVWAVVGLLVAVGCGIGVSGLAVQMPLGRRHQAGAFTQRTNNLKQIGLAVQNYDDIFHHFPSPYHVEGVGPPVPDPAKRLSWRVTLLPFLEHDHLYWQLRRSEPWDSPANAALTAQTRVRIYADPADGDDRLTRFRAFVGPGAAFDPDRPRALNDLPDGSSNTALVAEAAVSVPWPQYNELPFDPAGPLPPVGRPNARLVQVLMADGSVRRLRPDAPPAVLRALVTAAGGEPAPDLD